MLALIANNEAFEAYTEGKTRLPTARKVEEILTTRSELALIVPNARMCGRCHYGPVENLNCSDLLAHHGDHVRSGSARLNNSCPQCGWFTPSFTDWPRWDPSARPPAEEAQWAQVHAAEEDEAVARRARRDAGWRPQHGCGAIVACCTPSDEGSAVGVWKSVFIGSV